jgi:tRNA(Ile)-lysidine synthase
VDHDLQDGSRAVAERAAGQCRALGLDPVEVVTVAVGPPGNSHLDRHENGAENGHENGNGNGGYPLPGSTPGNVAGSGPEARARDARYGAFEEVVHRVGAVAVLLGHTRDDQAESVLLGLARGSGVRSLAGMPRTRGMFRRPLLDLDRDVVRAAVPPDAPVVDDPHNSDDRFARARVRHRVLPVLEAELGPGIAAALARTADLARADADALGELADEVAWDVMHGARDEGSLDVVDLVDLSAAVRSRVVRLWLLDSGCPAGALTAEHVGRVDRLVTAWRGQGGVALPGGVEAFRDYGRLSVRPTPPRKET